MIRGILISMPLTVALWIFIAMGIALVYGAL